MAEELVEFVVASDCLCDGEVLLRGEVRKVSKSVYRELVAAGRVCRDEDAAEAAKSFAASRAPAPEDAGKGKAKA